MVCIYSKQGSYGNGKIEFQVFSRTFFIFQELFLSTFFIPILYKTTQKNALFFSTGNVDVEIENKDTLVLFDSDSGDSNRDYSTNWIEKNMSRTPLMDVCLTIFTHFFQYLDLPKRPELPERPPKYRKDQRIIGKHWFVIIV